MSISHQNGNYIYLIVISGIPTFLSSFAKNLTKRSKPWSVYLFTTVISDHPNLKPHTCSLRTKRNLLIVQELYSRRVITKEAEIMNLEKQRVNSYIGKQISVFLKLKKSN